MPPWHNLVLRWIANARVRHGQNALNENVFRADIQFPQGSPGSNPGGGV